MCFFVSLKNVSNIQSIELKTLLLEERVLFITTLAKKLSTNIQSKIE